MLCFFGTHLLHKALNCSVLTAYLRVGRLLVLIYDVKNFSLMLHFSLIHIIVICLDFSILLRQFTVDFCFKGIDCLVLLSDFTVYLCFEGIDCFCLSGKLAIDSSFESVYLVSYKRLKSRYVFSHLVKLCLKLLLVLSKSLVNFVFVEFPLSYELVVVLYKFIKFLLNLTKNLVVR